MSQDAKPLTEKDYAALATFRHAIREFQAFSEAQAVAVGLTPQQHQALLAIRGSAPGTATIGHLADRLILKPHSASGLVHRLEALGLLTRETVAGDRRRALLCLTPRAFTILGELSAIHREEIQRLRPLMSEVFAQLG